MMDADPSYKDVHFWLGQALAAQGKRSDALQEFEKALSYDPDDPQARAALNHTRQ
jgi:TolA-binding protein